MWNAVLCSERHPKRQAVSSVKPRGDLISKLEDLVSNASSYPQDQHLVTSVNIFQGLQLLDQLLEVYQESWETHLFSKATIVLRQIQDSDM